MKRLLPMALAMALLLPACGGGTGDPTPSPAAESTSKNLFAMDTVMSFTAYGPNREAGLEAIEKEILALDKTLSVTNEDSEVWAMDHAGGQSVPVGEDTAALLLAARELGSSTGGALDVTMYPLVKAWGFTTGLYQIPDEETIQALLADAGYDRILVEGDTVTLPEGVMVDFGALAKGYAGEKCARILKEAGVTSAILRLSGNIQTVGAKPDGSPFRVAVRDPQRGESDYLGVLELIDQAAVTSGNYERYFEVDGVRYCHIIDPATGAPTQKDLVSVTIVGDSGTLCDGLSTALFVMGREDALDYWKTTGGFEAILVDEDKQVWATAGLKDSFTLVEGLGYTLHFVEE